MHSRLVTRYLAPGRLFWEASSLENFPSVWKGEAVSRASRAWNASRRASPALALPMTTWSSQCCGSPWRRHPGHQRAVAAMAERSRESQSQRPCPEEFRLFKQARAKRSNLSSPKGHTKQHKVQFRRETRNLQRSSSDRKREPGSPQPVSRLRAPSPALRRHRGCPQAGSYTYTPS